MDTATREYTAPFFRTVNNWLVGSRIAGTLGKIRLIFSSSVTRSSTPATHRSAIMELFLFVCCFSISSAPPYTLSVVFSPNRPVGLKTRMTISSAKVNASENTV